MPSMILLNHMPIDWTKIYKKYKGLWVAMQNDEQTVVASAKTAKEAWEKAKTEGCEKPILAYMPKELARNLLLC